MGGEAMMTREEMLEVAKLHKCSSGARPIGWLSPIYATVIPVYVQPKERPRSGRNGHVYTPKATQDCEKEIARLCSDAPLLLHPVHLRLTFYEQPPKSVSEGSWRWLRPTKGDLDNKVKTVTDALNGILYRDDKQICGTTSYRYYSGVTQVIMEVYRDGLSALEWEQVQKLIPHV